MTLKFGSFEGSLALYTLINEGSNLLLYQEVKLQYDKGQSSLLGSSL